MNVVTIEGAALDELVSILGRAQMGRGMYRLRVADQGGGVIVKVNEDAWSPTLGYRPAVTTASAPEPMAGDDVTAPACSVRTPRREAGGLWRVTCACSWSRAVDTLAEATRVTVAHEAAAGLVTA